MVFATVVDLFLLSLGLEMGINSLLTIGGSSSPSTLIIWIDYRGRVEECFLYILPPLIINFPMVVDLSSTLTIC